MAGRAKDYGVAGRAASRRVRRGIATAEVCLYFHDASYQQRIARSPHQQLAQDKTGCHIRRRFQERPI
jgi:hypothetical protein